MGIGSNTYTTGMSGRGDRPGAGQSMPMPSRGMRPGATALMAYRHLRPGGMIHGMGGIGAFTQDQLSKALSLVAILYRNGMPMQVMPWAMTQILYETGGLKSSVDKLDNNFSGIKYINKPYQKATRGIYSKKDKDYFAHFANYDAWAKDYIRILSLNRAGKGKPIEATSFADFVKRLGANGYFDKSPDVYMKGMETWAKVVIDALNKYKPEGYSNMQAMLYAIFAVSPSIPGTLPSPGHVVNDTKDVANNTVKAVQNMIPTIPQWAKVGGGILLAVLVVNAIKR